MTGLRPLDIIRGKVNADAKGSAKCPAHDDHLASLSVNEGEDGKVVLRCHAGCTVNAVMAAIGLPLSALFPPRTGEQPRDGGLGKEVAVYDYTDEAGVLLYQVVRFDPKAFRQRQPNGRGGWLWNITGIRHVLYNLPDVIAALGNDDTIYVVEGEKDCASLQREGLVATTNAMGAGKWRPEYSEDLAGATVIIIADADEPGRNHAAQVAVSLREAGCFVSVQEPKAGFKDVSQHLGAGLSLDKLVTWPEERVATRAIAPLLENYWGGDDYLDRGVEVVAPWAIPDLLRVNWRVVLVGGEGHGKALAVDTPLLTDRGWITMGEAKVGDMVFGPDGDLTPVVATTETMSDHQCYRVHFSDGSAITADADHLWFSHDYRHRSHHRHDPRIVTTAEMAATVTARDGFVANHAIPTCAPLVYDEAALSIHPYALGMWLGDGTDQSATLTSADAEVAVLLAEVGEPVRAAKGKYRWTWAGTHQHQTTFQSRLRVLGILGRGAKAIPDQYLTASADQRLTLLQGLMDADGSVTPNGHISGRRAGASLYELSFTDRQLSVDAHALLIGLGIKCRLLEGDAVLEGRVIGRRWRMCFQTDLPVFRLARKADRCAPRRTARSTYRYVKAVEPVDSVPVRCIQVGSIDGMYLAGRSLIATHNSTLLRQIAILAANGINPLSFKPMPPIRTILIDLENPDEAIMETGRPMRDKARIEQRVAVERNTWHLWTEQGGINLAAKHDQARFLERVELGRPQLVCIGPAYKMDTDGRDNNTETVAAVQGFLDKARIEYGFAVVIEHHAPKGDSAARDLVPAGSARWLRWPELGFKLQPYLDEHGNAATKDTMSPSVMKLKPYRGMRVQHGWPTSIRRGDPGSWPWVGTWPPPPRRAVVPAIGRQFADEDVFREET